MDIKGGIAITYRDENATPGPIGIFTTFAELNSILQKVLAHENGKSMLDTIVSSQGIYRFSEKFLTENPDIAPTLLTKGTGTKIVSKEFSTMPQIFLANRPKGGDHIEIIGRLGETRVSRFIQRDWLDACDYLDKYNVLVPEANGTGAIGEVLSTPIIGEPMIGSTDTFISIGRFASLDEANNCMKYVKSRFARTMLGILKSTQHNTKATWRYVPMQDFSAASDIDWTKTISEIDECLFAKYGLSDQERDFIRRTIKEMK